MRLRRITLSGFKTFAARSEVIFDPGITAIVGPNGSGKSNLVDAVRWALGETNARELRGQRMDEVIYAGGGGRQRMGLAQVELVIDNEEGTLPSEDPEVSVSRRVARGDRDTEFRINGEHARLRDLERLLGGTGLTQNGYAVVVQNDIDGIIEATPAQRRTLVEQAAGVRALRAACEDASHRLDGADADRPTADRSPRGRDAAARRAERAVGRGARAAHDERAAHRAAGQPRPRGVARRAGKPQAGAPAPRSGARPVRSGGRGRRRVRAPVRGRPAQRLDAARAARDAAARRLEDARMQVERGEGVSAASPTGSAPRSPSAASPSPTSTRSCPRSRPPPRRSPTSRPATSSSSWERARTRGRPAAPGRDRGRRRGGDRGASVSPRQPQHSPRPRASEPTARADVCARRRRAPNWPRRRSMRSSSNPRPRLRASSSSRPSLAAQVDRGERAPPGGHG